MIPQTFIQDLLARVDIVDVIERDVALKRGGANYSARCPFHAEKTPSFTVSPTKQFYHCFGCGAHGTAITFLMEYHGMSFVEAVRELASRVGMAVPEVESQRQNASGTSEHLGELLDQAARYYKSELKRSARAIDYLKGRGLSGEIAAHYRLGYAPEGWQSLAKIFPSYAEDRALVATGLVIENADGRRYDRFRDRIIFPIIGQRGGTIGFGGRVIGSGEPKYLNSPETPLFEKGRELYGLAQARQAIRLSGRILVVEGYMDVVALAQHGIDYAVATLGTATTPVHVQKLLRQSDRVVYAFDGDSAGRQAAWRALENSLAQLSDGKQISFLFLPEGDDPDSFVRREGRSAFEELVERAQPLSEFMLNELGRHSDLQSAEGKAKFLKEAAAVVTQLKAPMLSLVLRKRIAELAQVPQLELDQKYPIKRDVAHVSAGQTLRTSPRLVKNLLGLLCLRPSAAALVDAKNILAFEGVFDRLAPKEEWEFLFALLDLLQRAPDLTNISEHFRASPYESVIHQAQVQSLNWESLDEKALELEVQGAWQQLLRQLERCRFEYLLKKPQLSAEEKSELLKLQRRQNATARDAGDSASARDKSPGYSV